jgi:hypothetical protein
MKDALVLANENPSLLGQAVPKLILEVRWDLSGVGGGDGNLVFPRPNLTGGCPAGGIANPRHAQ